jgi:uncharacterized protein
VIIPDINLLIYAYDAASPFHRNAAEWWTSCLSETAPVGLPWLVILGFIRIATNARSFADPLTAEEALTHVASWLERPNVRIVDPGPRHAELLFGFLRTEGKAGNLTGDAHLAALAIESRAIIHTADTDFLRFSGVRCHNPLN